MVDFTDENEVKLGIESLPDFRGRITSFFDELCEKICRERCIGSNSCWS